MAELRVLERGTQIIGKELEVVQGNVLVVEGIKPHPETWRGDCYECYPASGGFAYLIPVGAVFEEFRQVHPSELERVPWEPCKFSLDEEGDWPPPMYAGVWKREHTSCGAIPWLGHDELLKLRDDYYRCYAEYVAKHGDKAIDDHYGFLFDERLGWCWHNANLEYFEILQQATAVIDGKETKIWNVGCGLIWTSWTEDEIAQARAHNPEAE